MKINLIVVGKTKSHYLQDGEADYTKRLKHYCNFKEIVIKDVKHGNKLTQDELKIKEGKLILKNIDQTDKVILLDSKGRVYSSNEFSNFLNENILNNNKGFFFIVGGAFGFSPEIYKRADTILSLSKMTFSHQMVRMIFKEQLYRAFSILKGEKYHHN